MQYFLIGIIFILALFAIHFSNKRGIPALRVIYSARNGVRCSRP